MTPSASRPRWSLRGVLDAALWLGRAPAFGLCALTLVAFAGHTHWLAELTTHFRPHYAAGLLACAAAYLAVGRVRLGATFALFALINAAIIAPRFTPREASPPGSPAIKLLLANVLTDNRDYGALLALIERERPDIVALLEVNDAWLAALASLERTHPHIVRGPRADNFGIAVFSRIPLDDPKTVYLSPAEVPSVRATLLIDGRPVRFLATHPLPPGNAGNTLLRDLQLAAVARWAAESPAPAIVLGDLNCTPWSPAFRRLLKEGGLHDTGWGIAATWPVAPWWLRIPLDHCLVTAPLQATDHRVGPTIGSDHFPVIVVLAAPPSPREHPPRQR